MAAASFARYALDSALRTTPCVLLTASEGEQVEVARSRVHAGADAFVRKEAIEVVLAGAWWPSCGGEPRSLQQLPASFRPEAHLGGGRWSTFLDTLASDHLHPSEGYDVVLARSGDECIAMLGAQQIDAASFAGFADAGHEPVCKPAAASRPRLDT